MKLKDIAKTIFIDPRKLQDYALNPQHPVGSAKARLFQTQLGFTQSNYQLLIDQIAIHAPESEAIPGLSDEYGQRYQVDFWILGIEPEQQEIVRTGWIIKSDEDIARLLTIYIPRRK
jgi:hypothetical protein